MPCIVISCHYLPVSGLGKGSEGRASRFKKIGQWLQLLGTSRGASPTPSGGCLPADVLSDQNLSSRHSVPISCGSWQMHEPLPPHTERQLQSAAAFAKRRDLVASFSVRVVLLRAGRWTSLHGKRSRSFHPRSWRISDLLSNPGHTSNANPGSDEKRPSEEVQHRPSWCKHCT